MDPHGRIEGEVWRKHHKFAIDQRPPECNEHESCQALSRAALSIVAQQAQSCHLAFKFFLSVHAFPQQSLTFVSTFCFWLRKE
jgi:hypothetical protein